MIWIIFADLPVLGKQWLWNDEKSRDAKSSWIVGYSRIVTWNKNE